MFVYNKYKHIYNICISAYTFYLQGFTNALLLLTINHVLEWDARAYPNSLDLRLTKASYPMLLTHPEC